MDRFVIALILLIGGITGFILYQIFSSEVNVSNENNSKSIKTKTLVDENKAQLLAENDQKVKSILNNGGYHYEGVFYNSGLGLNDTFQLLTVNVVYQADNGSRPLIVTEDPKLSKIIKVEFQKELGYN